MMPQVSTNNVESQPCKVFVNPNFEKHMRYVAAAELAQLRTTQQLQTLHNVQQQQAPWPTPIPTPSTSSSIHVNPQFLQRKMLEQQALVQQYARQSEYDKQLAVPMQQLAPKNQAKIISKSSKRIVRVTQSIPTSKVKTTLAPIVSVVQSPLISVSKRKLVRSNVTSPSTLAKINGQIATTISPTVIQTATNVAPVRPTGTKYKLDRRAINKTTVPKVSLTTHSTLVKLRRRRTFVARYALRRVTEHSINKKLTSKSVPSTAALRKVKSGKNPIVNKSLQLLNINGVLYKSSRNKLQRKTSACNLSKPSGTDLKPTMVKQKMTSVSGRTLFVRGTKFVMDSEGFKLTRVPGHSAVTHKAADRKIACQQQRIDIGGLTYVASNKLQNVFVRTSNHISRAHLVTAKQRSMQLLNQPLVKTNVPCPIFRRLGKCAAHKRGKCRKLHDKRQVIVCPSFLRGDCNKSDCLLSHNVSLSKMPVCKFFLQGVCVRDDCPYLHKKLSQKTEICVEFVRGYCALAEKCNKRHEFLCPEYVRLGKCSITNCMACQQMQRHQQQPQRVARKSIVAVATTTSVKTKNVASLTTATAGSNEDNIHSRYFERQRSNTAAVDELSKVCSEQADSEVSEMHSMSDTDDIADENVASEGSKPLLNRRPKIGILPAFIPL